MPLRSNEEMERLVREIKRMPGLAEQLPEEQRAVVEAALEGQNVHTIASNQRMEEAAVWRILDDAARWAMGKPPARAPEQAGLGSDTEPGIHGGYGDTAFGSLGNEPPIPTPEEPRSKGRRRKDEGGRQKAVGSKRKARPERAARR